MGPRHGPHAGIVRSACPVPEEVDRQVVHDPGESRQTLDGEELSIATAVGSGCCPGAEPAKTAGTEHLKAASGTFKDQARDVAPKYAPRAVNTDGWPGTRAAWEAPSRRVVIL